MIDKINNCKNRACACTGQCKILIKKDDLVVSPSGELSLLVGNKLGYSLFLKNLNENNDEQQVTNND